MGGRFSFAGFEGGGGCVAGKAGGMWEVKVTLG